MRSSTQPRRQGRAVGLLAPLLALLCACDPAGGGERTVRASGEAAARLREAGAELIADYGSYSLLRADAALVEGLPPDDEVELLEDAGRIRLNAGPIDTGSAAGETLRHLTPPVDEPRLHLVQFVGPVQPGWYAELEGTGARIVTYLPDDSYLVYDDKASFPAFERFATGSPAVRWTGDYRDEWKLAPAIIAVDAALYSIQLVEDPAANERTLQLFGPDAIVQSALGYVNVVATLDRAALEKVAARPEVVSIQPRAIPHKLDERACLLAAGQVVSSSGPAQGYLAWLSSKGFTAAAFAASGFGVDVTDSGLDNGTQLPNHFALYEGGDVGGTSRVVYNRIAGRANRGSTLSGCDGHGTINAHIIGGYSDRTGSLHADAAGYRYGLGVAPFVKLGSSVIFDPDYFTSPDYEDLQSRAYADGMRISSNSWGGSDSRYDSDAQRYDALVRDAQPTGSANPAAGDQAMVIVFAGGNDGPGPGTIGTPATAKNVISVGASENVRPFGGADGCTTSDAEANGALDVASFSSRGPTADGRKKPDLMAPGTHVVGGVAQASGQRSTSPTYESGRSLSCFDGSGVCGGTGSSYFPSGQQWYTASSGTSHATPVVAGAAALVRQYFIDRGMAPPSPAMTKALLINAARYMNGTGAGDTLPSNNQGFGLLDLGAAFDDVPRVLEDQASLFTASGQTRSWEGVVSNPSRPFRITLAWTDAPGSTTGSAWKNDLDLTVSVGGVLYRGNVFSGATSIAGGSADARNNVESVFLPAGTTGPYLVTVRATNVNSRAVPSAGSAPNQDFALVITNAGTGDPGDCTLPPQFAGLESATSAGTKRCANELTWSAATPSCGGAIRYSIYRGTEAGFVPSDANRIASGLEGTSYVDADEVAPGTRITYVVRAVESSSALLEETNTVERSAVASGCDEGNVAPGDAVRFAFEALPSVRAGAAVTLRVRALDAAGSVAAGYAGTASVRSSDAQAVLPAGLTFTGGEATLAVELRTAGTQTIAVEADPLGIEASVTVEAGDPVGLHFSPEPQNGSAGAALQPVAAVLIDRFGNLASGAAQVELSLASGPDGATLGGPTTAPVEDGSARFTELVIEKAGEGYRLVARSQGLSEATSAAFSIAPGAVETLAVSLPATVQVNKPVAVEARALDRFGNLATGYAAAAAISSSDPGAVLQQAVFEGGVLAPLDVTFGTIGVQDLRLTGEGGGPTGVATVEVVPQTKKSGTSRGSGCGCGAASGPEAGLLGLACLFVWSRRRPVR